MIGEISKTEWLMTGLACLCLALAAETVPAGPAGAGARDSGTPAPFTLTADQPPPAGEDGGDDGVAPPADAAPERNDGDGSSEDETESYSEPEDPGFGGCQFNRRPLELMV